ncbi:unnamed protein product, partial [Symbiodinium pilosum]
PCACTDGYYPVGKEGWSPGVSRGYEFTCCLGNSPSSCGEDKYAGILSVALLCMGLIGMAVCTYVMNYCNGLEPLTKEDIAVTERPRVHDGERLHQTVGKHKWCVTLKDLRQFRRLVRHAIADGVIKPTDQDPFDTEDTSIGPSMYTVNMQYIQPVTAAAGNPSWALMLHPEGLKCDLFITHGWAEGVFEFVDQVVNSWPFGAKAAYVCFLSTPQNLDIAEMIERPEDSPFAKALGSASQVLAAPNHKKSIYTRAWCVFEAYLAFSWGKAIYTATSPPSHFWAMSLRAASWSVLMLGVCFCMMMHGNRNWALWSAAQIAVAAYIFGGLAAISACFFAYLMVTGKHHWKTTKAAVFACSAFAAGYLATNIFQTSFRRPPYFVPFLMFPFCFWAMECDRLLGIEAAKQARQLREGFTGNPADGMRIRNTIEQSGAERAVDATVAVLLRMNLSTPELRLATAHAGSLGNASNWSRSIFTTTLTFWVAQAFNTALWRMEQGFQWIPYAAATEAIIVVIGLPLLPRDRGPFAERTQSALLLFIPGFLGIIGGRWYDAILNGIVCPLIILVAFAGPARTSRIPALGPMLVRLLFARNPLKHSSPDQTGVLEGHAGKLAPPAPEDDYVSI